MTDENEDLEKDLETTEAEEDNKVETPEPPQDENEPIEVTPADVQRQNRRERRQARESQFRQAQEERDRLRRENEELRARQYQPPPQPQQPQVHPAAQRLVQIDQAIKDLHDRYRYRTAQPGYDPNGAEQAEFERRNNDLQTARMATVASAAQPQFNETEVIRKAQLQMYLNEHQDITQDPAKMRWAYARWQQYIAEGKEDTRAMSDAVFEEARRRFGMPTRSGGNAAADPATRQRLSGVSARGGSGAPQSTGSIKMGPHEKRMARQAFGDRKDDKGRPWSEAQQYQHWANTVGKKLQEQKGKGG